MPSTHFSQVFAKQSYPYRVSRGFFVFSLHLETSRIPEKQQCEQGQVQCHTKVYSICKYSKHSSEPLSALCCQECFPRFLYGSLPTPFGSARPSLPTTLSPPDLLSTYHFFAVFPVSMAECLSPQQDISPSVRYFALFCPPLYPVLNTK